LPRAVAERFAVSLYGGAVDEPTSIAYEKSLRERIAALRLDGIVALEGFVTDVQPLLLATDWAILPSTHQPCSVALIESLAGGRPVLVSRSGGNIDLIREGETGYFFRPDDADDLARLLQRIHDGAAVTASREEMRASVAHCRGSAVAEAYRDLYTAL